MTADEKRRNRPSRDSLINAYVYESMLVPTRASTRILLAIVPTFLRVNQLHLLFFILIGRRLLFGAFALR